MDNQATVDKSYQIAIEKLTIKRPDSEEIIDILPMMAEIDIYEDLYAQTISAKMVINDRINFVGLFPLVGSELISLSFKTELYDKYNNLDFIIYKIDERDISADSDATQTTCLFLCTPEVMWSANNDTCVGLDGSYDDIITKLLDLYPVPDKKTKKTYDLEKTFGVRRYVAPSWNIFRCIKFCANHAFNENNSPYFFYETIKGYHLKSLETLYKQKSVKQITFYDRTYKGLNGSQSFNNAYSFEYLTSNDTMRHALDLGYGVTAFQYDIGTGNIQKFDYDYKSLFNGGDIHLDKHSLPDSYRSSRQKITCYNVNPDESHLSTIQKNIYLEMMTNTVIMLNIPGDSELKTGDVIDFEVPFMAAGKYIPEPHTSGRWLVTSIKHMIRNNQYTQVIECVKDSFAVIIRKEDENETSSE